MTAAKPTPKRAVLSATANPDATPANWRMRRMSCACFVGWLVGFLVEYRAKHLPNALPKAQFWVLCGRFFALNFMVLRGGFCGKVCLASIERALIGGFVVCRCATPAILGGSFFLYFAQKNLQLWLSSD